MGRVVTFREGGKALGVGEEQGEGEEREAKWWRGEGEGQEKERGGGGGRRRRGRGERGFGGIEGEMGDGECLEKWKRKKEKRGGGEEGQR